MQPVLIAGCGYVGVAAADLFHAAGWKVEGWTHSAESASRLAEKPYPVHAVDIAVREAVEAAAGSFEAVIHSASSGGGGAESYRRIYLAGARNLLNQLRIRIGKRHRVHRPFHRQLRRVKRAETTARM